MFKRVSKDTLLRWPAATAATVISIGRYSGRYSGLYGRYKSCRQLRRAGDAFPTHFCSGVLPALSLASRSLSCFCLCFPPMRPSPYHAHLHSTSGDATGEAVGQAISDAIPQLSRGKQLELLV